MIESEALAERVLDTMERDFTGENSWRLTLEADPQTQQKRLYWHALKDGKEVRLDREPGVGFAASASSLGTSEPFRALLPEVTCFPKGARRRQPPSPARESDGTPNLLQARFRQRGIIFLQPMLTD